MPSKKRGRTSSRQISRVESKRNKTFPQKKIWIVLASILVVSIITLLSSINDDSITGRIAVQSFGFEPEGRTILFEANEGGIKQGTITFASETKGGKIYLEVDNTIPFDGKAYSKVRVSAQDLEFSNLDLVIKLEEKQLNLISLNRDEISLYVNGKRFPAVLTKIANGQNTYTVKGIREAGEYVIGKSNPTETAATITTIVEDIEEQSIDKTTTIEKQNEEQEDKTALAGKAVETEESTEPGFFSRTAQKIIDFFKS